MAPLMSDPRGLAARGLAIHRFLPNAITLLALCSGLTGLRFALHQKWEAAVLAILVAAIFDALDGRVARLLKSASKFGAELDSLSDVISFGVAPAFVLYLWGLGDGGGFGWIATLALVVSAALRLARFNTMLDNPNLPAFTAGFFTGIPAPAGAALALLPIVLGFVIEDYALPNSVTASWVILIALLMVSRIPTYSMKKVRIPAALIVPLLLGVGLLAAALVTNPWPTLLAIGTLYALSIPFSALRYQRLMKAHLAGIQS
jgi:CDP-diacylglycerol---serine O-phosphatidyltransferase